MHTSHTTTDRPLDGFTHTHFGIVVQLDHLAELPALLAPAELARRIAKQTLNFFQNSMYEHHAAEERALFPATIQSAKDGIEREKMESMTHFLITQHRVLESLWEKIEPELKHIAKGVLHKLDQDALSQLVNLYKEHARIEECEFLPLARDILSRNKNHMEALDVSLHMLHQPYITAHI